MIVTIANRKGGVGKTTTAFNLGFTYALQKREVLFIDLDSQANLSLLCKADTLDLEAWKAGTVQQVGRGVSILPATKRFAALENEIDQRFDRNTYLREELLPKLPAADIIIIDTAPALGVLNINAFVVSDFVHIVVNADSFSMAGLREMKDIIEKVRGVNPNLEAHIVLNASFKKRSFTGAAHEALARESMYTGIEIPHRQHITNSNALGRPAIEADEIRAPFKALAEVTS